MRRHRDCETPQAERRPDRPIEGLLTIAILLLAAIAKANEFEETREPRP
jgi:hypothetical protein